MMSLSLTLAQAASETELDRIVAIVNDEVIVNSELERQTASMVSQLRKKNPSTALPPANVLAKQVLERMIIKSIQLQIAKKSGIKIDNQAVNKTIARIAKSNGLSIATFRQVLENDGIDYIRFRADLKDEIILKRLESNQVESRVIISDREIDSFLKQNDVSDANQKTEYQIAHILISIPEAVSPEVLQNMKAKATKIHQDIKAGADFKETAIAFSDGRQALEGGSLGWRNLDQIPILFVKPIKKMKPGDISDPIKTSSGYHIIQLTDIRGGTKKIINQIHARHILIKPNDLVSNDDAKRRLGTLKERIENGDDFSELARSNSDDPGSSAQGGDLGWTSPGSLVPRFEQEMQQLKLNEISEPFRTQYGWHIIQVLGNRQYDNTEDYKRAKARQILHKRKLEEEFQLWVRRIRDESYVEIRLNE